MQVKGGSGWGGRCTSLQVRRCHLLESRINYPPVHASEAVNVRLGVRLKNGTAYTLYEARDG